jgi:hypothetical protein
MEVREAPQAEEASLMIASTIAEVFVAGGLVAVILSLVRKGMRGRFLLI